MFADICAHELFFKITVFIFLQESRSFEVTRREGRENAFILISSSVLISWKYFVEAKMNFRLWVACSQNFMWPFLGADHLALGF